jgi:glycosyltransferase involved in cell wall biosynthesis
MPLVSIIIPCHNSAQWLSQAIDSALAQTHHPCEVIVADDDSSDASPEIIAGYGEKIRAIHGQWHNGSAARNAGLAIAQGQWVQFLDADDLLLPGKIQNQLACTDDSTDVVFAAIILRHHRDATHYEDTIHTHEARKDIVENWLRWDLCQTGGFLWRRSSLLKIGAWNKSYSCCQDNELSLRAIKAELRFAYCEKAESIYRIWSSDSTTSTKNPEKLYNTQLELIEDCLQWLNSNNQIQTRHYQAAGEKCFCNARTIAAKNLHEGINFYNRCRKLGLMHPSKNAAPTVYRVIYHLLGFAMAERIAKSMRKFKS